MSFNRTENAGHLQGDIRTHNADFQVDEIPDFEPSGDGEHVCLKIRKSGQNTEWTGKQLADIAGIPRRDVSYAGLKDRHAVTTQWFSVWLPGKQAPDWSTELPDSIEVLEQVRHHRKVRIGTLKGNQFRIILRNCSGDREGFESAIQAIKQNGVPNYFGAQRFGRDNHNIERATSWFTGEIKPKARHQKSMYLSAARSWLFNHYLSERVKSQSWNQGVDGDVFQLDGSNSCFYEPLNETLQQRVTLCDLHPTGALWGDGELVSKGDVGLAEASNAQEHAVLSEGLIKHGLKQDRRSLRLLVGGLKYDWQDNNVLLSFSLKPGAYATSVLQELGCFSDVNELNKRSSD